MDDGLSKLKEAIDFEINWADVFAAARYAEKLWEGGVISSDERLILINHIRGRIGLPELEDIVG